MSGEPARVLFAYWGRRGGGARMTLDLARAAVVHPGLAAKISISRNNELFADFETLGTAIEPVETFASGAGALTQAWRLPALKRQIAESLDRNRTQAVVTLMPHVWSPLVAPTIRRAGVAYVTIVHDGAAHPGDKTGLVHSWLLRDVAHADLVVTLSQAVTDQLKRSQMTRDKRLVTLFSPDMGPAPGADLPPALPFPAPGQPLRLAFIGRIMPYKGLALLAQTVLRLRRDGVPVVLGVHGHGNLGAEAAVLAELGAEIDNRWLSEAELGAVLARTHAVVLSHTEASQSGVAALAGGHGVPLISTPVGGLIEQVVDGRTGLLAAAATSEALGAAIRRLAGDRRLYESLCAQIRLTRGERSCGRFLDALLAAIPKASQR